MFNLDTNTAKAYDLRGGFINEAGKYTGHIESAVWHVKDGQSGQSQGLFLNFISDSKQKARFYINTSYHGGTVNERGVQTVNALLACLKMRSSGDPVQCPVKEYDKDAQREAEVLRPCFTQLHNKPIGIVVQMVHEDGQQYPNASLFGLFNPTDEFTASETLNQATEPKQLGKLMAYIADRPLHDKRKSGAQPGNTVAPPKHQATASAQRAPADDIDDDIPF